MKIDKKKNKRFKALHTRFYVQPNMQKKLNAVGYGDTCNNNINIFYTCIRIAKKRNRYRVVIKDIHLIFWNTVSNLWDFFKHLIFFLCAQVLQLCRNLFDQAPLINSVVAVVCLLSHVTFLSVCWECPGCLSHGLPVVCLTTAADIGCLVVAYVDI